MGPTAVTFIERRAAFLVALSLGMRLESDEAKGRAFELGGLHEGLTPDERWILTMGRQPKGLESLVARRLST